MRLPDRGLFRKYSKGPFVIGGTNMKRTTLTVPLVMLMYQTQSRRVAVATRDSES